MLLHEPLDTLAHSGTYEVFQAYTFIAPANMFWSEVLNVRDPCTEATKRSMLLVVNRTNAYIERRRVVRATRVLSEGGAAVWPWQVRAPCAGRSAA